MHGLLLALLAGIVLLSGCGTGVHSNAAVYPPLTLSGNWQFTTAAPADGSFIGGLQGGFLLQKGSTATGSVSYSIALPAAPGPCNSGSAAVTGMINGQNVTLNAVAGTQTFSFTGTLSFNAQSMAGTYTSTSGTASDGSACGTAQAGLQWSAVLIPPLTGSIQGYFDSAGGPAGLSEQDFALSGGLVQAANTGASSASVTGTLSFLNSVSNKTDYPCIAAASVNGQISGNTVALQLNASDGSNIGQIGAPAGDPSNLGTVTLNPQQGTYILQATSGLAYAVYSAACGGGTLQAPADFGNVCLALNSTSACTQPITLTPPALSFPAQVVGTSSTQAVTLTSNSSNVLDNLTLTLNNHSGSGIFSETDTCGPNGSPSNGNPFSLLSLQSCAIKITFTPQCTNSCPSSQTAALILNILSENLIFTLPISGTPQPAAGEQAHLDVRSHRGLLPAGQSWYRRRNASPSSQQDTEDHAETD